MSMSRKDWHKRLIDAGLPEDVVTPFLKSVADEDLVRMKDMETDALKALFKEELDADTKEDDQDADDGSGGDDDSGGDSDSGNTDDADKFVQLVEAVGAQIKEDVIEAINARDVQLEVPEFATMVEEVKGLKEIVGELLETMKELKEAWNTVSTDEDGRLRDVVRNLSPAQKNRMRISLNPVDSVERVLLRIKERSEALGLSENPSGVVVKDSEGNVYGSLADMAAGNPIKK